jgi:hypothetical protein
MQTANQNPEPSTVAAPGVSPVRSALAYVALAFAFSWLLWMLVIKAHGREAFLYFGEAGPAVAAIALSIRRQRDLSSSRIQRVVWFISMLALCWIVLSLHYLGQAGAELHFRPDPILILPAVLPAWVLSGACSSDAGVRALLRRLTDGASLRSFRFPPFSSSPQQLPIISKASSSGREMVAQCVSR